MEKLKKLSLRGKIEYIFYCMSYPFLLLFDWVSHPVKHLAEKKKQIASVIITIIMLFNMLPGTAFAVENGIVKRTICLDVQSTIVDKDGNLLTPTDGVYDMLSTEGWKWDSNTNVLTLNGVDLEVSGNCAIVLAGNTEIELIGTNSVVANDSISVQSFGNLTISGTGSVNIRGRWAGINADDQNAGGNISVAGGVVNVTSTNDSAVLAQGALSVSGSANLTANGYYCGLQANGSGITISGAVVEASSTNDAALFTKGSLAISDSSSVTAANSAFAGINAKEGITVTDSIVNAGSGVNYTAIYTPKALTLNGTSKVTANGDFRGIQAEESITIGGSAKVTVNGKNEGLASLDVNITEDAAVMVTSINQSAISGKTNLSITENANVKAIGKVCGLLAENTMILSAKNIDVYSETNYAVCNVSTDKTITIGGNLKAESSNVYAIRSFGTITADNTANITAVGGWGGIQAGGDIAFTGSTVEAVGHGDDGIYSTGMISITGGSIHAAGGEGYVAIRAKNIQTADEAAISKIDLTDMIEKNGGKTAFCDWYDFNGDQTSWTTFISRNDNELISNNTGGISNGLPEVWLAAPCTVTFDVNGGSGTNSTVNVYAGNHVSAPETVPAKNGCHFSGWYLDGVAFDFANTAVTQNITLKAQLDPHISGDDDSNCTTAITCSVCGEITTTAKTHAWDTTWTNDSSSHWHTCKNAGCTQITDSAAHVPGKAATIENAQVCTVCGYEISPKLQSKDTLTDGSSGIEVRYENGSAFEASIVLSVTSRNQAEMNQLKATVNKAAPGFVLGGLYDVKLLKDGIAFQPEGKVRVSIPLTRTMKAMKDLKMVYIDSSGNAKIISSEIKDGKIIFITDHFSNYGVIGKVKAASETNPEDEKNPKNEKNAKTVSSSPQTGDTCTTALWIVLLFISAIGLAVFSITKIRRKDYKK